MDVLLVVAMQWTPVVFIVLPIAIVVLSVVALWVRHHQELKDWTPIGGGLVRMKVTGGWLLRRTSIYAARESPTFVPDPDHANPPEAILE